MSEVKKEEVETKVEGLPKPETKLTSEEAVELIKSREAEFQARQKAEAELKKYKDAEVAKVADEQKELAQKSEANEITKKWRDKCQALEKQMKLRDEAMVNSRVDSLASELASKVNSDVPELYRPMIRERLKAELTPEGTVKVTCLDKSGLPTSLTPDELAKEIIDNKKYSRYIVANRSSGTQEDDANVRQPRPVATIGGTGEPDLSRMSPANLVAFIKTKQRGA